MTNNRLTDNRNPFIRSTKPKDNAMIKTTTHRSSLAIPDSEVATASDRVNQTKLVDAIREWRAADRGRKLAVGRAVLVSDHAILVGMLLLASDGHPIGARTLVDLFAARLTNDSRLLLGIDQSIASPHDDLYAYRAVHNALRRLCATIDPYPHKTAALPTPANSPEAEDLVRVQSMRTRLEAFSDAFLTMTLAEAESKFGTFDGKLNVALAGTNLAATHPKPPLSNPNNPSSVGARPKMSRPLDGRFWSVKGPDRPEPLSPSDNIKFSAQSPLMLPQSRWTWGWEAIIALHVPSSENDAIGAPSFPKMALAMRLHSPSIKVQETSITVLQRATRSGSAPGVVIADRPYFEGPSNGLGVAAIALGYKTTYPYRHDRLGIQGADEKMILVEGSIYHPDIPRPFINATIDYLAGRIDEATYQARLSRRELFVVRPSRAASKRFQPQLQAFPYGSKAWTETYRHGRNAAEHLEGKTAAPRREKSSSLVEAQLRLTVRLVAYNLHEIERQSKPNGS